MTSSPVADIHSLSPPPATGQELVRIAALDGQIERTGTSSSLGVSATSCPANATMPAAIAYFARCGWVHS